MSVCIDDKGVSHKITHIMSDGKILDSINNYPVPENNPVYDTLVKMKIKYSKALKFK